MSSTARTPQLAIGVRLVELAEPDRHVAAADDDGTFGSGRRAPVQSPSDCVVSVRSEWRPGETGPALIRTYGVAGAFHGGCRVNRSKSVAAATVGRRCANVRPSTPSSRRNGPRARQRAPLSRDQLTRRFVDRFMQQPPCLALAKCVGTPTGRVASGFA